MTTCVEIDDHDLHVSDAASTCAPFDLLIVDDNSADAELSLLAIRRAFPGLKAHWVGDGRALLHSLEKCQWALPRLIVTDLHMPGIGGTALVEKLRQNPALQAIPVISVSADATGRELTELKRLGVHDFVEKSVDFSVFAATLAQRVGNRLQVKCKMAGTDRGHARPNLEPSSAPRLRRECDIHSSPEYAYT